MIKSKSFTLRSENGGWLGQIVISEDGMFGSVTDWGNLSYAWRSFNGDFREFLSKIGTDYFAGKMAGGLGYIIHGKKISDACVRYAEKILPTLQAALREDLKNNPTW